MFSQYDKFIVAIVMAVIGAAGAYTGKQYNVDPAIIAQVVSIITAALVYVVPNKKAAS